MSSEAAESSPSTLEAFGKFFLIRKIAEGGMAEIFLAKQPGSGGFERDVVIKRMLPHMAQEADLVAMFLDEGRLVSKLTHPGIVQVSELGEARGSYYICMEYLAGEDFSAVLRYASRKGETVPLAVSLRVILEACRALHYAHEQVDENGASRQIVHRDVSPSNLFVTYLGHTKLLDFGIASAQARLTKTGDGTVKGKYAYMAPEQALGTKVDRRSDVFALGCCLYEALTRRRPFPQANELAILKAVTEGNFVPPSELREDIPLELESIVLSALALKPEERFQSAGELADQLEKYLAGMSSASTSGHAVVAAYMRSLFGEERVTGKSRIPSLESLGRPSLTGIPAADVRSFAARSTEREVQAATVPLHRSKPRGTATTVDALAPVRAAAEASPTATTAEVPIPPAASAPAPSGKRRWVIGVAAAAVAAVGALAWKLLL